MESSTGYVCGDAGGVYIGFLWHRWVRDLRQFLAPARRRREKISRVDARKCVSRWRHCCHRRTPKLRRGKGGGKGETNYGPSRRVLKWSEQLNSAFMSAVVAKHQQMKLNEI